MDHSFLEGDLVINKESKVHRVNIATLYSGRPYVLIRNSSTGIIEPHYIDRDINYILYKHLVKTIVKFLNNNL